MSENYYNILGLNENSSKVDIKKKYRVLSLKYHPDRPDGNEEKFKEINKAYSILSDDSKRREYDNTIKKNVFGGGNNMDFFNNVFGMNPDIKRKFNNINRNMRFKQNLNIEKVYEITLNESWSGVIKTMIIDNYLIMNGSKILKREQLYLRIPAGINNGSSIILKHKGHSLENRIFGDVKVNIVITNNTEYIRDEMDLILKKKITFKESLVGFKFDIKHLSGKKYCINNFDGKVIRDGYMKVVPKLGFYREENNIIHRGNLLVVFSVDYPDKLEKEIRDKLAEVLP